jgi:hypothetical protein
MRRHVPAIIGFFAALVLVCLGVRREVPTHAVILSEKMTHLAGHRDDYSILLLGSSHVYRHLVPRIFDAEIASATGQPHRSFNLGAPGLALPEAYELLDTLLSAGSTQLRWVIIDTTLFSETTAENQLTRRDLDWHTLEETLLACKYLFASRQPLSEKVGKGTAHLKAYLLRSIGSGRIAEHARYVMGTDKLLGDDDLVYSLADEGYRALDSETGASYLERARTFRAKVREGVVFRGHNRRGKYTAEEYRAEMFARMVDLAEAHGVRVAFFDPPRITTQTRTLDLDAVRAPLVFDVEDSERYPSLYDLDLWFDQGHLNRRGSETLTTLLARELARTLGDERAVR